MKLLIIHPERLTEEDIAQFGAMTDTSVHLAVSLSDAKRLISIGIIDVIATMLDSKQEFDFFTKSFDSQQLSKWVIGLADEDTLSLSYGSNVHLVNSIPSLINTVKQFTMKTDWAQ
ncbi:MAG: hypothetical protein LHW64_06015 [Candidatus Cloacimonetes bacterium]|nr:hypothetical protein [Candidatus Cloacimonadota bacterium]MCB5287339.1 hypothetical protein [Candidatus Cloacimonadota bacterium]MCK9183886.1 hypothetical protein [Candidatus Cloacimonadota bacterium]MCK9583898.1 hypothetical protein [Candidatus Cloacimonadota bacterium]MDY0229661.1 hypothetical protein [Candidatus Cloacimonadaceae bacterium]